MDYYFPSSRDGSADAKTACRNGIGRNQINRLTCAAASTTVILFCGDHKQYTVAQVFPRKSSVFEKISRRGIMSIRLGSQTDRVVILFRNGNYHSSELDVGALIRAYTIVYIRIHIARIHQFSKPSDDFENFENFATLSPRPYVLYT